MMDGKECVGKELFFLFQNRGKQFNFVSFISVSSFDQVSNTSIFGTKDIDLGILSPFLSSLIILLHFRFVYTGWNCKSPPNPSIGFCSEPIHSLISTSV